MYEFKLEPDLSLLTVTRFGFWSIDTVRSYEADLRRELETLQRAGGPTSSSTFDRAGRRPGMSLTRCERWSGGLVL